MKRSRLSLCKRTDGLPKHRYDTRRAAWDAVRRMVSQGMAPEDQLKAYQCPDCDLFHVGRPRRVLDQRRQANARRRHTSWS